MSNNGDSPRYPQAQRAAVPETSPPDSPGRIRAARDESRLYLHTLADWVHAGFLPFADADREVTDYFQALAERFSLTADEAAAAQATAWRDASLAAVNRLQTLRKLIRRLAWDAVPLPALVTQVTAEADHLHANFGNSQLETLIAAVAKPIQQTLARRGRS